MATTLDALVSDGSTGNVVTLSDFGHLRTEVELSAGVPLEWTVAMPVRVDSLAPGKDGQIWSMRKVSDDARNHGGRFDDGANRLANTYNIAETAGTGTNSFPNTTWVLATWTYPGTGSTVVGRLFSMADGSQIGTDANGTASSFYDDGQTQQMSLMADYDGSTTGFELIGRIVPLMIVRGAELSSSKLGELAADWLNVGGEIVATYDGIGGVTVVFIDDSKTDQGSGGETLTLLGTVTWGSGNGPTVPDRVAVGTTPAVLTVGKKSLGIVYDLELAVPYTGADLGTDEPLVQLTSDSLGVTNLVTQTVRSYGDTSGTFDCSKGALTAGPLYLKITNQTIGDASYGLSDLMLITVRTDPGAGIVAARRAIPTQSSTTSSAISTFDGAGEFYLRNAQESLTYSKPSGSFPTGISINSTTGAITGTIDSGAAASSPYTATVRCTDSNGDYAEQVLSWVVGVVVATTYAAGSWGRRTRR